MILTINSIETLGLKKYCLHTKTNFRSAIVSILPLETLRKCVAVNVGDNVVDDDIVTPGVPLLAVVHLAAVHHLVCTMHI